MEFEEKVATKSGDEFKKIFNIDGLELLVFAGDGSLTMATTNTLDGKSKASHMVKLDTEVLNSLYFKRELLEKTRHWMVSLLYFGDIIKTHNFHNSLPYNFVEEASKVIRNPLEVLAGNGEGTLLADALFASGELVKNFLVEKAIHSDTKKRKGTIFAWTDGRENSTKYGQTLPVESINEYLNSPELKGKVQVATIFFGEDADISPLYQVSSKLSERQLKRLSNLKITHHLQPPGDRACLNGVCHGTLTSEKSEVIRRFIFELSNTPPTKE